MKDIDNRRIRIRVEQTKGKKDRDTLQGEKTPEILRTYFLGYKHHGFATHLSEAGTDIRSLQSLPGPEIIKTTES